MLFLLLVIIVWIWAFLVFLSRTIDVLDSYGISHLGTYKSEEAQKEILFKTVKGIKIAFIDYTYGTNGIPVPKGKDFCVNLINRDLIKSQIDKAKSEEADIIVACMHWGTEYRTTANDEQIDLADFLFQNGCLLYTSDAADEL